MTARRGGLMPESVVRTAGAWLAALLGSASGTDGAMRRMGTR